MWWEQEERRLTALWVTSISKGMDAPHPDEGWDEFNKSLAEPFGRMELKEDRVLRLALGVA